MWEYGTSSSYLPWSGYRHSEQFLPKVTFTYYTEGTLPACLKPAALTVPDSSITTTTAWVHWTDRNDTVSANGWTLLLNDSIEVHADTNPFELTGLNPSSAYTVRVKANCDALDASDWSGEMTFYTQCGVFVLRNDNPFIEDFNNPTFYRCFYGNGWYCDKIPYCWDNSEGTTTRPD